MLLEKKKKAPPLLPVWNPIEPTRAQGLRRGDESDFPRFHRYGRPFTDAISSTGATRAWGKTLAEGLGNAAAGRSTPSNGDKACGAAWAASYGGAFGSTGSAALDSPFKCLVHHDGGVFDQAQ